ncbi:MAG TPA: HD-GYP domain-containing protein [Gammaproteobacteria bacterium]|jgi:HD-GYP domain-containing protein (c-di-GMP phosphodiesterase class II)
MRRKLNVSELVIGMYVAELDKPWEKSAFLFQGFTIESDGDIAKLHEECQFVFIDEVRSTAASLREAPRPVTARPATSTTITSRGSVEPAGFHREIKHVVQTQQLARTNINRVLDEARLGKTLDTKETKGAVTQMVSAVTANPNSMLWLTNLRLKHERTASHCLNSAILCIAFGKHVGMSETELNMLGQGAMLHDIGKVRIPPGILDKAGALTEAEIQQVRKHPIDGEAVLKLTRQLPDEVLKIVRHHHERVDGKGYPDALAGDQVPMGARIVGMVDTYDSLTTETPYNLARAPADALAILRTEGADQFGQDLVQEFIRCLGIYPIGSLVQCNNGALAVVVSSTPASRLKPVIMVIRDDRGKETRPRMLLSLATMDPSLMTRWGLKGNVDPKAHNVDLSAIIAEDTGT